MSSFEVQSIPNKQAFISAASSPMVNKRVPSKNRILLLFIWKILQSTYWCRILGELHFVLPCYFLRNVGLIIICDGNPVQVSCVLLFKKVIQLVCPYKDYCPHIWGSSSHTFLLHRVQSKATLLYQPSHFILNAFASKLLLSALQSKATLLINSLYPTSQPERLSLHQRCFSSTYIN